MFAHRIAWKRLSMHETVLGEVDGSLSHSFPEKKGKEL
jgi:hypothetical protein